MGRLNCVANRWYAGDPLRRDYMREGGRVALVVKGPPACWIQQGGSMMDIKTLRCTSTHQDLPFSSWKMTRREGDTPYHQPATDIWSGNCLLHITKVHWPGKCEWGGAGGRWQLCLRTYCTIVTMNEGTGSRRTGTFNSSEDVPARHSLQNSRVSPSLTEGRRCQKSKRGRN